MRSGFIGGGEEAANGVEAVRFKRGLLGSDLCFGSNFFRVISNHIYFISWKEL